MHPRLTNWTIRRRSPYGFGRGLESAGTGTLEPVCAMISGLAGNCVGPARFYKQGPARWCFPKEDRARYFAKSAWMNGSNCRRMGDGLVPERFIVLASRGRI